MLVCPRNSVEIFNSTIGRLWSMSKDVRSGNQTRAFLESTRSLGQDGMMDLPDH